MNNNLLLLDRRCVYFKSGETIYRLAKIDGEYELSFWNEHDWEGKIIKENTVINLLNKNEITCSLQQVHFWILGLEG